MELEILGARPNPVDGATGVCRLSVLGIFGWRLRDMRSTPCEIRFARRFCLSARLCLSANVGCPNCAYALAADPRVQEAYLGIAEAANLAAIQSSIALRLV